MFRVPVHISVVLFLFLPVLAGMSGCNKKPGDKELVEAWTLCENLEYEKAFPVVREYLLHYPDNPVAHYLLGKCYQQREEPALTLAKGELDMARFLFSRDGDLSVLVEAMTANEFQATLHNDTVLVLLRSLLEAEEQGMPPEDGIPVLYIALEHAQKAAEFNPNSPFILDLAHTLETMLKAAEESKKEKTPKFPRRSTPKPEPPPPPGTWLT